MNKLAYQLEFKETLRLAIPIVIAQLGVILMGVTDTMMVGQLLGSIPLGAAGLGNSLAFLVMSIGLGALGVVSTFVAQARGRNDDAAVSRTFWAGLWVAVLLGVIFAALTVLLAYNLDIFQLKSVQITQSAKSFMVIMGLSTVPLLLFTAGRQFCEGLKLPRIAMFITLGALVMNLAGNWLFIKGFGIIPAFGLNGSALATLVSRVFMCVAMLGYVRFNKQTNYYLSIANIKNLRGEIVRILKIGVPGGFSFFFEIAAFTLAVVMIGWLGEAQLAAHQIAINMASTTYMMATGIAAAGSIRVGYGYGQRDYAAILRSGNVLMMLVVGFMAFWCIIFVTSNNWLVGLYIQDKGEVAATAASLVLMAAIFQLSDGIQVAALGMLRSLTDVNVPTWITLFAYWGVGLPMSYVFAFPLGMDVVGVWVGLSLGLTISAILLTSRFYRLLKTKKQQSATVLVQEEGR